MQIELSQEKRKQIIKIREMIINIVLLSFAAISIFTTFAIILSLFTESLPFFNNWHHVKQLFEFGHVWDPKGEKYNILPIFMGTLMIVLFSCLFAIPLGLGSAIYLSEYAKPKTRNVLKPILEILAGIPSVVYGFFALLYITPFLKYNIMWLSKLFLILLTIFVLYLSIKLVTKALDVNSIKFKIILSIFGVLFITLFIFLIINFIKLYQMTNYLKLETFNVLSASIAVGIMITPLVASISEDALKSVPKSLRKGAFGLGATKFETVCSVVVPAAISGIVSSFILAISRAIGETMIVSMAAGAKPVLNLNPLGQIQTMTGYMVSKSFGEVVVGTTEYQTIFVVGLILFFITLILNILAKQIINIFREVY